MQIQPEFAKNAKNVLQICAEPGYVDFPSKNQYLFVPANNRSITKQLYVIQHAGKGSGVQSLLQDNVPLHEFSPFVIYHRHALLYDAAVKTKAPMNVTARARPLASCQVTQN